MQVVYDLQRMTRMRRLPLPLHSVSEDGARGLAVNMQRLEAASPGVLVFHCSTKMFGSPSVQLQHDVVLAGQACL